jgi:hypothetical protein
MPYSSSTLTSGTKPGGSRGRLSGPEALQAGHGMPAPPHPLRVAATGTYVLGFFHARGDLRLRDVTFWLAAVAHDLLALAQYDPTIRPAPNSGLIEGFCPFVIFDVNYMLDNTRATHIPDVDAEF